MKTVTFRIWRTDGNGGGKFVDYTTEITEGLVVLDVVHNETEIAIVDAKRIRVYFASLNGKAVGYELSLSKFGDAVSAMNDAEAKRHSWLQRVFL